MREDISAVALRFSIRAVIGATPGDPLGMRNIITHTYPDGALCFVNSVRSLYQLDKGSTATADNLDIVAPVGGPGRWIRMAQGAGAESIVEIVGTDENAVPTSENTDFLAITGDSFDWQPTGAPGGWSLVVVGGVVTYAGAVAARALVTLRGSVYFPAGGGGGGLAPGAVDLGTAGNYTILAKTGITNVPTSSITGDMGASPVGAASITGFALVLDGGGQFSTSAQVIGQVFAADYAAPTPATLTQAVLDMQAAFTDAQGRVADFTNVGGGAIGGMTLVPGVYKWTTAVGIATDLTLSGGPTDVFILCATGTISIAAATSVLLTGGVKAENVFWQCDVNFALGATSHFEGVLLALTDISLVAGATANGRLLAQTAVNLNSNEIVAPAGVSSGVVWAAVAQNGDLIGDDPTVSFLPGTQTTLTGSDDEPQAIISERLLLLSPGDTLQAVLASDAGADLSLQRATLSILLM